ncbi:alpha-mannosidase [Micromonospora sp. M71_S20]|uniref:alpha-mannosidase n=1 Tax=Micromonospora sp. M71_S20 TaxID=592872 RepID=UPI000F18B559|nr:alpha-mannosidase [Micromonospora sp. M71_S20]RLK25254.1 alpha-mannosidase [Micromonospora sp. M71_S20]
MTEPDHRDGTRTGTTPSAPPSGPTAQPPRQRPAADATTGRPTAPVANAPSGDQPPGLHPARRPAATPQRTLHMIGNAHLDPVWLWPWQEGYQETRATFWSAIHRMEEYPDFVFTCNQVVLLSWVEESDPELFARIRERVAEGRWQMVGGWWVEPDCNMPSGESFVRQGLYGQRYLKEKFGVTATVGMNVDPFGHNGMLPQILRGQGMHAYCFLRPGPHESNLTGTAFWWESPDGSRVLAYRIPFEYCSPPGDVAGQTDKSLGVLDHGLGDMMIYFGVGNHGGGPTRANIESIHRYDRMGSFGRMVISSPARYFDEFAKNQGEEGLAKLPVWRDDLQMHAPGCYSAHSGIKLWQRRAQAAILSAERWAVLGSTLFGLDYPTDDLGRAWRQILFNQFHDVLPGSAIESAYDDARDQLGEAVAVAKRIITRTHNVIARHVDIPLVEGTQPVLVFNPHPWPVTAQVELQYGTQPTGVHVVDADDRVTLAQRTQSVATTDDKGRGATVFEAVLPPLGYRLYRLRSGAAPAYTRAGERPAGNLRATDTVLENDLLRVEIDPETGWLRGLLDKRTGVDLVAGARGEHTQICQDPTDTWGHRVVSYRWPGAPMRTSRVTLREAGPLRARLRVERAWNRSTMVEEFILGHRDDHVEVRVTLDWREQAHLLKLCFPTAVSDPVATYEIPFGSIGQPVDGGENPAQSWVDVSGTLDGRSAGLAVVNNAKHGYDVSPGDPDGDTPSIGITAVRSPVYSWHDPRQLDPDGFYSYQDQGIQSFRYLLVPHGGDWRQAGLFRRAAELGAPVRAMLESFHRGPLPAQQSYLSDGGDQVMVTAVKGHEDGGGAPDLIVRAVETTGRPARVRIDLPVLGRVIEADFGPSQLRTFRVPVDGGAVREVDLIEWDLAEASPGSVTESAIPAAPGGRRSTEPDRESSDATMPAERLAPNQRRREGG